MAREGALGMNERRRRIDVKLSKYKLPLRIEWSYSYILARSTDHKGVL